MSAEWTPIRRRLAIGRIAHRPPRGGRKAGHRSIVPPLAATLAATLAMRAGVALARAARERRADIVNNFASSRHATVFEGVPQGRRTSESIQKIMSIPILSGDDVLGVAQICRKGDSAGDAGPDFSPKDLSDLQALNALLGRFLALHRTV